MEKIFVDATDTPIGRLGSYTAKQALLGNKIFILNCEKSLITGRKENAVAKWKSRRAKGGSAHKGPYHSKDTEKIVKRAIRGMLPNYRSGRGKEAWSRIRCYNGVPKEYEKENIKSLKRGLSRRYIKLKELKEKL